MANTRRSFWPGLVLLILGTLFLLDNLEVASFGQMIKTYWPVILILVGLGILFRWRVDSAGEAEAGRPENSRSGVETQADTISESSVFGEIAIKPISKNFRGGSLSVVFGEIDLNLTSAELAPGVQDLGLNGVFGSLRVTVPKDVGLFVRGNCMFGDITVKNQKKGGIATELRYKSENYDSSEKKLNINASQVFGDIKIW